MQTSDLDRDVLRRLAELRPGHHVLSLFVNLDPSEFATPQARSTQFRSLLDATEKRVKALGELDHDELKGLRADIARAESFFNDEFSADGAHGLAIYLSEPADLFEVIRLPRPVDPQVFIDDSPLIEPLADLVSTSSWCVLLVGRRSARLLRGSREELHEVPGFSEAATASPDEGSTSRGQHAVDADAKGHLKIAADELLRRTKRHPCDRLLVGSTSELYGEVQAALHSYLKERLVGHIDVDVENSSPHAVLAAALPTIEGEDQRREREALDRLAEGVGTGGRGVAGLDETLAALNEQRVEVLLMQPHFRAPGVVCQSCGWVGAGEMSACPVDSGALDKREDVIESALELALAQSAEILVVHHHDDLIARGKIGAVLRF